MNTLRILEISWLIITVLGFLFGVYKWITASLGEAVFIFIIAAIAAVFYTIRRKQRIAFEKRNK
ncbi:MAG: hypothetical protein IPJ79_16455 [Bacteroidetes bacterium]|nr:hypothetical protein [Bacteroidota bacterium]HNR19497.1 hypothetical protein [Bacteroidia bacterium]HNU31998.1 hypothetical protein [Bacteroidia bacterium]